MNRGFASLAMTGVNYLTLEALAKVILNGVKNLGWGITSYLIDPPPQTLRFAQGDIIGAFCKRLTLKDIVVNEITML